MMVNGAKTVNMMMVRVMVMLMIRIVWSLAKLAPSPLPHKIPHKNRGTEVT